MRNQSFDKQHENILATISAQRADLDFMIENAKNLQQRITSLEGKTLEEHQEKESPDSAFQSIIFSNTIVFSVVLWYNTYT